MNIKYIDLNENEIVHFLYIKKVKLSNGKYRYYYDTEQHMKDNATISGNLYNMSKTISEKTGSTGYSTHTNLRNNNTKYTVTNAKTGKVTTYNNDKASKALRDAQVEANRAYNSYSWAKAINRPIEVISKGILSIFNFFNKNK